MPATGTRRPAVLDDSGGETSGLWPCAHAKTTPARPLGRKPGVADCLSRIVRRVAATPALLGRREDLVPLGGSVVQRLLGALLSLHDVLHFGGHDLVHLDGVGLAEKSRARIRLLHLLGQRL